MKAKIRIKDPAHSVAVQTVLFEMGYKWIRSFSAVIELTDKKALYVDDDIEDGKHITWGCQGSSFDIHSYREHWLVDGKLVTSEAIVGASTPPPVVLRSRKVVMQERVKEIAQAVIQAFDNGQEIPHNWQRELDDLLSDIRVVRD